MRDELVDLGLARRALTPCEGGFEVLGTREVLWTLATRGRLAESIRVRIGHFEARRFEQLEAGLAKLPWHAYLPMGSSPRISATCRKSRLYHSGAVEERTAAAIASRWKGRKGSKTGVALSTPAAPVHVRIERDHVQVSVNASGELLHRRGYRTSVGKAPIRETLAAACIRAADLDRDTTVWDPFCGSGTLAIEWLASADRRPAWLPGRRYGFESWPTHDAIAYEAFIKDLPAGAPSSAGAIASDIDEHELEAARNNASAAGLGDRITWHQGDFEAVL